MVKNVSPEIAAQWIALYYIGITSGRFISGFITMKDFVATLAFLPSGS
jgi:hypothetical protein